MISFFAHAEQVIRLLYFGKVDGFVGDDDFGFGGAAPGFRAVALALNGVFAFQKGRFGKDDAGEDEPLTAGTGQTNVVFHLFASFCAISMILS